MQPLTISSTGNSLSLSLCLSQECWREGGRGQGHWESRGSEEKGIMGGD